MTDYPSPDTPLWGKQTGLALEHFAIGNEQLPSAFLHAYAMVKFCTAATHKHHHKLPKPIASAIMQAASEIMQGQHDDQFPLSVWQSGSGTQFHMNINEVLASRANQILKGGPTVHANDHCNLGQSTNDSFPTALHIAAALGVEQNLLPAISRLINAFNQQSETLQTCIKTGRTHLQDATPVTLGQTFSSYSSQLSQCKAHLSASLPSIKQLTIGGTAVGTGLNSYSGFASTFCHELSILTSSDFSPTDNCFANQAAHDAIVQLSGSLNTLACALNKIASDLRLMASGPRCGFAEILLPANEPGSSIMPGKVNPSQCEMLNMVCVQVIGNHTAISMANAQGQLELNTFKPLIAFNILQSLQLLSDAINNFCVHCVTGIKANSEQLAITLEKSLMLITALTDVLGYDKATELVNYANQHSLTLRQAILDTGLMSVDEFDQRLRPEAMLKPQNDS